MFNRHGSRSGESNSGKRSAVRDKVSSCFFKKLEIFVLFAISLNGVFGFVCEETP